MHQTEFKLRIKSLHRLALAYLSAACLYTQTASVDAAPEATSTQARAVDSVYSWGSWAIGLEPLPGPRAPTNRALKDRSTRLQFRPNDNAAYQAQSIPVPTLTSIARPPPIPRRPAAPERPIEPVRPIEPARPIEPVRPVTPAAPAVPVVRPDGTAPAMPGAIPTAPNRRR